MNRREIVALAIVYTLMMALIVQFIDLPSRWAIIIAVANVWFWIGRMSSICPMSMEAGQ